MDKNNAYLQWILKEKSMWSLVSYKETIRTFDIVAT